jgi:hypothetical protein
MKIIIEILIGICVLFGFMYVMGYAFQKDLKDMQKTHPKFRKHLKDKYDF